MILIPLAALAVFLLLFAPKTKIEDGRDRAAMMQNRYKPKPHNDRK